MINLKAAMLVAFLGLIAAPAFADDGPHHGVPLPIVGAGVPALMAVAAGYLFLRGKQRGK